MIASQVNPYLFTAGGTIRGDYKFKNASVEVSGGGAIELEEEAKLQKKGDDQMSIRFTDVRTEVAGDMNISGILTGGNLGTVAVYPTTPAFDSITTKRVFGNSAHMNSAVQFPNGLVSTDAVNGIRSNLYRDRDGQPMMDTDGTKISVYQELHPYQAIIM